MAEELLDPVLAQLRHEPRVEPRWEALVLGFAARQAPPVAEVAAQLGVCLQTRDEVLGTAPRSGAALASGLGVVFEPWIRVPTTRSPFVRHTLRIEPFQGECNRDSERRKALVEEGVEPLPKTG